MSDENGDKEQMVPKARLDAKNERIRALEAELEETKALAQKATAAANGWKTNFDDLNSKVQGQIDAAVKDASDKLSSRHASELAIRDAIPGAPEAIRRLVIGDHDGETPMKDYLKGVVDNPPDYLAPWISKKDEAAGDDDADNGKPAPKPAKTPGNEATKPTPKPLHPMTTEAVRDSSKDEWEKVRDSVIGQLKL